MLGVLVWGLSVSPTWSPHYPGSIKFNFDVGFDKSFTALGVVARNADGIVIGV